MKKEIKVKTQLVGKRYLSEKYQSRIIAKDIQGNEWRIKKEAQGFIFRHVENNTGIYGYSETIHDLVCNALTRVSGISVYVVDDNCL